MDFLMPLIRPYLSAFTNPVFAIFTLLSLLQVWRGVPIARTLWQNWSTIRQEPLTASKKNLADQAAFFIAVPFGVFLHELGHAIVVWLYGGRVVEFGFFFFWGYVLPDRRFAAAQEWTLASAGTWANLVYAVVIWLLLGYSASAVVRYFGKRAVRYQFFFALIYYPIFTLIASLGDWRTIYNFGSTPLLSGITAVCHLLLLGIHMWLEYSGRYEELVLDSPAEAQRLQQLEQQADLNPHDLDAQAQLIATLQQARAGNRARRRLRTLLKQNPDWSEGHYLNGISQLENQSRIPRKAIKSIEKSLSLGLSKPQQKVVAHQILGNYYAQVERFPAAVEQLTQALAAGSAADDTRQAQIYYLRATIQRRQRNYPAALQDINQALALVDASNEELRERFQQEKTLIERFESR